MARKGALLWLSGITLGLVGIACLVYSRSDIASASADLDAQRDAARKEGLPLEYSQLHPAQIPMNENAAEPFLNAVTIYEGLRGGIPKIPTSPGGATPHALWGSKAELAAIRAQLAYLAPAIKAMERVANRPRLVLDRPYEQGPDLNLPEYAHLKALAKSLVLRAELSYRDGHEEAAFGDLATVGKLASLLQEDPTLIGTLTRMALEAILLRSINEVLGCRMPTEASLDRSLKIVRELGSMPNLRKALRTQVVESANVVDWVVSHMDEASRTDGPLVAPEDQLQLHIRSIQRANTAHALKAWREVYRVIGEEGTDYERLIPVFQQMEEANDRLSGPGYILADFTMPHASTFAEMFLNSSVRRRIAELGIELLQARLRTGRWPGQLPKGKDIHDPFGPGDLVYKPSADGFMLYSFGRNRVDNGGRRLDFTSSDDDYFVFPFVKPPVRPPTPGFSGPPGPGRAD